MDRASGFRSVSRKIRGSLVRGQVQVSALLCCLLRQETLLHISCGHTVTFALGKLDLLTVLPRET